MKLQLLFLTIYLITIAYSAEDSCADKQKSQCTSTNGCTWTKTTDAKCENQCSTLAEGQCTSPCSWTVTGTCTKKTFDCTNLDNTACTDSSTHADEFCTWTGEVADGSCGDSTTLDCASKDQSGCTTAANTCTWNAGEGTCGLSGTDTCISLTENTCTGSCAWTDEIGTCASSGGGSGSGSGSGTGEGSGSGTSEGSGSDSSGFLKLSVFICLFVLFL